MLLTSECETFGDEPELLAAVYIYVTALHSSGKPGNDICFRVKCLPFVYRMATSRSPRILAKRAPQELEVASKETQPLRKRAKLSEGKGMHCKSCRLHTIQCHVFIGSVIPRHLSLLILACGLCIQIYPSTTIVKVFAASLIGLVMLYY